MYNYPYGNYRYQQRYNETKNNSSSLSNVYKDIIGSNRNNFDTKKSYDYNNPTNYHFLKNNSSSNIFQNKSMSPSIQSNISKNFFGSYNQASNNYSNNNEVQRNKSLDYKYNANKGLNNISSYKNDNNNINLNNKNSFSKKNFYDTLTSFGRGNYNKLDNSLFNNTQNQNYRNNNNENYKNNYNYSPSTNRTDLIYKNYFNENNRLDNNNINSYNRETNKRYNNDYKENYSNNSYKYSKSPENYYNNIYKNISNDEKYNYTPIKNFNYDYSPNRYSNNTYESNQKKIFKVLSYGYYTMAGTNGYGITKTNQDSYLIKTHKNNSGESEYTFGVFDGHGLQGHFVSQAIKQFFTNCSYFNFNTKSMILSIFSSLSKTINNSQNFDSIDSGSTVILTHINKDKIISVNCGDSRAILITKNNNIILLSRDHKPELPEEKMRIEASGGRIDKIYGMGPYRVWFKNEDYPGLAMSRSIGDRLAHRVGVSDIPEIEEFDIGDVKPLAIILASDGVWEFMTNDEVKSIVKDFENNKDANACSKKIVEKARIIWEDTGYAIDDITCVVVFFN